MGEFFLPPAQDLRDSPVIIMSGRLKKDELLYRGIVLLWIYNIYLLAMSTDFEINVIILAKPENNIWHVTCERNNHWNVMWNAAKFYQKFIKDLNHLYSWRGGEDCHRMCWTRVQLQRISSKVRHVCNWFKHIVKVKKEIIEKLMWQPRK